MVPHWVQSLTAKDADMFLITERLPEEKINKKDPTQRYVNKPQKKSAESRLSFSHFPKARLPPTVSSSKRLSDHILQVWLISGRLART